MGEMGEDRITPRSTVLYSVIVHYDCDSENTGCTLYLLSLYNKTNDNWWS